ncbi:MAG TPA: ATPase [Spirochaetia bacterium]|nr:ATPase [Spirochaetia bacterium]
MAFAAEQNAEQEISKTVLTSEHKASVTRFGLIAAAIAFGCGAIAAGFAIANVGSAAMGAVAEKPEIAGQALIFIALAEGLVVFGFITSLMILGKI